MCNMADILYNTGTAYPSWVHACLWYVPCCSSLQVSISCVLFCLSSSCVLCTQCCQYLWIVFVLCLVYPMLPVSLDCPFLIASFGFLSCLFKQIPLNVYLLVIPLNRELLKSIHILTKPIILTWMVFHTLHVLMYMTSNFMKVGCQNYSYQFYPFTELVLYNMISRQLKSSFYVTLTDNYHIKGIQFLTIFHLKLNESETKENKLRSVRFTLLYRVSSIGFNSLY